MSAWCEFEQVLSIIGVHTFDVSFISVVKWDIIIGIFIFMVVPEEKLPIYYTDGNNECFVDKLW